MSDANSLDRRLRRETRFDAALAAIPIAFGLSYLFGATYLTNEAATLGLSSVASGVVILMALFYDPPNGSGR